MTKLLLLFVLISTSTLSCNSFEKGAEDASISNMQSTVETVKLTYMIFKPEWEKGINDIIKNYENEYPNVKIILNVSPWDNYWTRLETAAMVGDMPDIFFMQSNNFLKFVQNDVIMPLNDKIDGFNWFVFHSSVLSQFEYKQKYYGMPSNIEGSVLFFNKRLFDEKKVSYPDNQWDWNMMVDAAKKLTDREKGIYGFGADNNAMEGYYNAIYQNGGYVIKNDRTQSGFNDSYTVEAIQWWKDLIFQYKVSPALGTYENTDIMEMFTSGKLAMAWFNTARVAKFAGEAEFKYNFDIAPLPYKKARANIIDAIADCISLKTEYPDEALLFVSYLGSNKAAQMHAETGIGMPAKFALGEPYLNKLNEYNTNAIMDSFMNSVPMPNSKSMPQWSSIEEQVMDKILKNEIGVKEGCSIIAEETNRLLKLEIDNESKD